MIHPRRTAELAERLKGAQPAMRADICIIYDAAGTPIATLDPDTRVRAPLASPTEGRQP